MPYFKPFHFLFCLFIASLLASCDLCMGVKCANGGECRSGACLCADGNERPICKIDTCIAVDGCVNGHCEYGFCVCDDNWGGERCNVRTYINHSGDFFGGFECNNTYISTATIEVREENEIDTFEFYEQDLKYTYNAGFTSVNEFEVPRQKVLSGNYQVFVDGSGSINAGEITYEVHYRTFDPYGDWDDTYCTFTGLKR